MSAFGSLESKQIIGIVGATGAVGIEIIGCLHKRNFPIQSLMLFASARSSGKVVATPFGDLTVQEFTLARARSCEFLFLCVSGDFSLDHVPKLLEQNGDNHFYIIDNSSAYRYHDNIPLIVPEINGHLLKKLHHNVDSKFASQLIANPNCTTAIAAVALWPIHQKYKIKKLIVSTYQAASGAGAEGMEELIEGTKKKLNGEQVTSSVFAHPLPFNLIPHIDKFQSNGYTKEEMKVVWETLKIFDTHPEDIKISCTAVRIPTLRAHSEAITIETELPIAADDVKDLLKCNASGVRVVDDPASCQYPMPLTASESFDVEVGRIRQSLVFGDYGIDLFVCGDQLLRGAALNAVLIAEYIIHHTR